MKKGFVFVETMVVIAFLGTILLSVYSAFTSVIDSAKTRLFYDDPIYLYRTYYMLTFLEENGLTDYIDLNFKNNNDIHILQISCATTMLMVGETGEANDNRDFCSTTFSKWNVSNIYIMRYNVSDIVKCMDSGDALTSREIYFCNRNTALVNLSLQATNYLYSLDGYTGVYDENAEGEHYRIVVEYKIDTEKPATYYDYYCSAAEESRGECQSVNNTTIKISKYYYASLEVPYGKSTADSTVIDVSNPLPVIGTYNQKLKNTYLSDTYRNNIKTITLQNSINIPNNAVISWDISESNKGNVMAYLKTNALDNTKYDLYIQGDGELIANKNSNQLFANMPNLTTINNLALLDTSRTIDMSYMFSGDFGLSSLDLSSFDTSKVTTMNNMFRNDISMTSLDLSSFDTSKVVDMSYMFCNWNSSTDSIYNSKLTSLNISSFNTSNVTKMDRMFHGLNSLTTLNLNHFNTSKVIDMTSMFSWCTSLTSINVNNFDTRLVTSMKTMFYKNEHLTSLNINSFQTPVLTNVKDMFAADSALTDLRMNQFDFTMVTGDYYRMFNGMPSKSAGAIIRVKDASAQSFILGITTDPTGESPTNPRPPDWDTTNVIYN